MVVSQNGWPANDPTAVSSRPVPGTDVKLTVRKGAAGDLLLFVAGLFDTHVEDIDNARGGLDDWGYAERPIRGGVELSNHASGTAIDLNATRHPLGTEPTATFGTAQIATIRAIVASTIGVVRWGGDYTGRKDPMHFELADGTTEAECAAALAILGGAVQLSDPLRDLYRNDGTTMTVGDTIAWAAAHAARARDAAQDAAMTAKRIEAAVGQLLARPAAVVDSAAINQAVVAALGGGLDITGTATPKGQNHG